MINNIMLVGQMIWSMNNECLFTIVHMIGVLDKINFRKAIGKKWIRRCVYSDIFSILSRRVVVKGNMNCVFFKDGLYMLVEIILEGRKNVWYEREKSNTEVKSFYRQEDMSFILIAINVDFMGSNIYLTLGEERSK